LLITFYDDSRKKKNETGQKKNTEKKKQENSRKGNIKLIQKNIAYLFLYKNRGPKENGSKDTKRAQSLNRVLKRKLKTKPSLKHEKKNV